MEECSLCQRQCHIDRTKTAGRCGGTDRVMVARAALHLWEEPCISGEQGSGTVFFVGCPLRCVFCQNAQIAGVQGNSHKNFSLTGAADTTRTGKNHAGVYDERTAAENGWMAVSADELARAFLRLQKKGANNINLVTPTHYVPQIIQAVRMAKEKGLHLPIVYNTGTYETPETVRALADTVDIFLPDFKFYDAQIAERYAQAPDYFECAASALSEMVKLVRERAERDGRTELASFDERGLMQTGVIVRHLILPGHTKDSRRILKYLHDTYGDEICISIMNQYTPMEGIGAHYPELARKVTKREYERVIDYALEIGITNAYVQEGMTASESFIPSFHGEGIREVMEEHE